MKIVTFLRKAFIFLIDFICYVHHKQKKKYDKDGNKINNFDCKQ
jgi:hypothetical protein